MKIPAVLRTAFLILILAFRAGAQANLYVPDGNKTLLRWPIINVSNNVYYLSDAQDTINGWAIRSYYFTRVNANNKADHTTRLVCRDTAFSVYEDFQAVPVQYSYNKQTNRFNFFIMLDEDSSATAQSIMLEYPKTIYFTQWDAALNTTIAAKPVIKFDHPGRYAGLDLGAAQVLSNNRNCLLYLVRDTFLNGFINYDFAGKFLITDDTGKTASNAFIGWEPLGNGSGFASHEVYAPLVARTDNTYLLPYVYFGDSIGTQQYLSFILDSNLHLIDTLHFEAIANFGNTIPGKSNASIGDFTDNFSLLPSGSIIRSSGGGYIDNSDGQTYQYYGIGKGDRSSGYNATKGYFPPKSDTGDYDHSSNFGIPGTIYHDYDNLIYTFTSTKSNFLNYYCYNGAPNMGQLSVIDTNLQQRWVKYLHAAPGYCITTFSIAQRDHHSGIVISGREISLNNPGNDSLWRPFIYVLDSATNLGIGDPHAPITIRNRIVAYPNPALDNLNVDDILGRLAGATLTNMQGQLVYQSAIKGSKAVINIKDYPPGLYLLRINTSDGELFTQKIMKQ